MIFLGVAVGDFPCVITTEHAESDLESPATVPYIAEAAGLAGSSRDSWSFVPIMICSCQRLLR
jgi:hypothetical protein